MLEALRWLRRGAADCRNERQSEMTEGRVPINCHVNEAFQGRKWDSWTGPIRTENFQSGTA